MINTLTPTQAALYQKALHGEIKLIGWGFRDNFHFHRWQEHYPISLFVDANFNYWDQEMEGYMTQNPLALRDYDPARHALINYYHAEKVALYTKRVSGIESLPPMPLQHLLYEIETIDKAPVAATSPLSAKEIKHIVTCLDPFIKTYDPKGDKELKTKGSPLHKHFDLLASYSWIDFISGVAQTTGTQDPKSNSVVLACNSLYPGGAERQIINCALGFAKRGWTPHFLATVNDTYAPHYLQTLQENNISVKFAMEGLMPRDKEFVSAFIKSLRPDIRAALWHMPIEFIVQTACTMRYFKEVKPRLVIAYLDWANVIAALAGVFCGVPEIIISGRNYPPPDFPHFFENVVPVFHSIYQVLANCPNVHFTNNSPDAGRSYAQWLGLSQSKISFVPNCLTDQFMTRPKESALKAVRARYRIKKTDKIVLGVFRLAPEKRPDKFLSIFAKLAKADKNARAIICGIGPLLPDLQKQARKLKIEDRILFSGLASDVREIMNVSSLLLHTSNLEGMPNVMLEAQSQGLPIVCTKSGGVDECLAPELLPYSFATDDFAGVTKGAGALLKSAALREKLGQAAQRHARSEFSIPKLIERYLDLTQFAATKSRKKKG